jgi:hypothetical protein
LETNKNSEEILQAQENTAAQSTPLWMICLICASFSLLSAVATYYCITNIDANKKMAIIDMNLLMKIKLLQLQQSPGDMKAVEADASAFSESLKKQFSQYSAAGVLLVNSQAVLNKPSGIEDVTENVAKGIGLQLPAK